VLAGFTFTVLPNLDYRHAQTYPIMNEIPQISTLQAFAGLLQHGYQFIQHTCQKQGTKIFGLPLLEEDILCFYGIEASEVFYDPEKFERRDTMLRRAKKIWGNNSARTSDGASHASRERIQQLTALIADCWESDCKHWQPGASVNLHMRARQVFCRAVCAWTGIPLREEEVAMRADDLYALEDALGAIGGRHRRSRKARKRMEAWLAEVVVQYRTSPRLQPHTALHIVAMHRDAHISLLDSSVAASELINMLYPVVAIATCVTFAALALHEHPSCAERVRKGDIEYITCFIEEVRRLYPIAPFVSARARKEFAWQGYTFPRGALVLLDIYGTNHDGARWHLPEQFDPGRFYRWNDDPFEYIPPDGESVLLGHRSAGEALTAEVLKVTLLHLTQKVKYEVPEQDLGIDLTRMPALPKSGFILRYMGAEDAVVSPRKLQSQLAIAYPLQDRHDA
jgi:fatty-acid peroxygenase